MTPSLQLAAFLLLFASAPPANGFDASSITGTVFDLRNEGVLPGAVVTILKDGREVHSAVADRNGAYSVENIEPGRYTLTAQYVGFSSTPIREIRLRSGEEAKVDLYMGFRPSEYDFEHGRREAHEDLARGQIELRNPDWLRIISTGRSSECIEHEQSVRASLEANLGIERANVSGGYPGVPEEVALARIAGYNEVMEAEIAKRRGYCRLP